MRKNCHIPCVSEHTGQPGLLLLLGGGGPVTVWTWLKLTACLWLIRKAFKLTWWLLLAVAAIAAWPVTVVTAAGYTAAWLRGWPPVRLYRAAAWSLPVTAAWLIYLEIRVPGFLAARDPRPTWAGAGTT